MSDSGNEHVTGSTSQHGSRKIRHRLAQLRNRSLPQPVLVHSMARVLVPGKSARNRRGFRDALDYPHGSTGRNANHRNHSLQRLRCIRNLLQQVPLHNHNPVDSLTPYFRNILALGHDLTGRFQSFRCRTE